MEKQFRTMESLSNIWGTFRETYFVLFFVIEIVALVPNAKGFVRKRAIRTFQWKRS
jgi:hypothetical protein